MCTVCLKVVEAKGRFSCFLGMGQGTERRGTWEPFGEDGTLRVHRLMKNGDASLLAFKKSIFIRLKKWARQLKLNIETLVGESYDWINNWTE